MDLDGGGGGGQEVPLDPNNTGRLKSVPKHKASESKARKEWERFMESSKMGQVVDMWDAKQAEALAPTMSRKQLEQMTERVRAAGGTGAAGGSKDSNGDQSAKAELDDFVTFDQLYANGSDFDSDMADRVARRKARFEGQYLTDEDVGQKAAPKKKGGDNGQSDGQGGNGGRLWGAGADTERSDAADEGKKHQERRRRMMKAEMGDDRDNRVAPPGELLEIRSKNWRQAAANQDGEIRGENGLLEIRPKNENGLMEIRPKKRLPTAEGGGGSGELLEIKPKRQGAAPTGEDELLEIKPRRRIPPSNELLEIRPKKKNPLNQLGGMKVSGEGEEGSMGVEERDSVLALMEEERLRVEEEEASPARARVQEAQHADASSVAAPLASVASSRHMPEMVNGMLSPESPSHANPGAAAEEEEVVAAVSGASRLQQMLRGDRADNSLSRLMRKPQGPKGRSQ
eukprot:gene32339-5385_t